MLCRYALSSVAAFFLMGFKDFVHCRRLHCVAMSSNQNVLDRAFLQCKAGKGLATMRKYQHVLLSDPNFMTKLTRPRHAASGVFRRKFPELTATTRNMAARQTVEGLEHFLFDHVVCNPVFSVRDRNFKK